MSLGYNERGELVAGGKTHVTLGDGTDNIAINEDGSINTVLTGSYLSDATTMQNAAAATGNGTELNTNGYGVALLAVSGTFVGTITFEGKGPDDNWYSVNAQLRGSGAVSTTATTTGLYEINCRGLTAIRSRISAYTSGSITVKGKAQAISSGESSVQVAGRNVRREKIIYASNIASTGAKYHPLAASSFYTAIQSALADVRHLKNINVTMYNNTDVSISVTLFIAVDAGSAVATTQHVSFPTSPIAVASGAVTRITPNTTGCADLAQVFGYLAVQTSGTPTTGGFYITVEGEPR